MGMHSSLIKKEIKIGTPKVYLVKSVVYHPFPRKEQTTFWLFFRGKVGQEGEMHLTVDRESVTPACAGQVTQGQTVTHSDFTNI